MLLSRRRTEDSKQLVWDEKGAEQEGSGNLEPWNQMQEETKYKESEFIDWTTGVMPCNHPALSSLVLKAPDADARESYESRGSEVGTEITV